MAADWATSSAAYAAYVRSSHFARLPPALTVCKCRKDCKLNKTSFCPCAAGQVVENWYPGAAKDSKGVLLVVTAGKEGAISGGDKFLGVSDRREWTAVQARTGIHEPAAAASFLAEDSRRPDSGSIGSMRHAIGMCSGCCGSRGLC